MKPIAELKYWKLVQQLMAALQFPGTTESISYGTPSFKVKNTFLCRLLEDGKTMVIHSDDRDQWIQQDKDDVFFVTEHYFNYPYVLVRLTNISKNNLRTLLITIWKEVAPPKLLKQWEGA
jgi:hypothetical protein